MLTRVARAPLLQHLQLPVTGRDDICATAHMQVVLHEGYHRLAETLVLGPEDSGAEEAPVVWRGGKNVFVGSGVPISGWQQLKEDPPNLAAAARGKLWVADSPPAPHGSRPSIRIFSGCPEPARAISILSRNLTTAHPS